MKRNKKKKAEPKFIQWQGSNMVEIANYLNVWVYLTKGKRLQFCHKGKKFVVPLGYWVNKQNNFILIQSTNEKKD